MPTIDFLIPVTLAVANAYSASCSILLLLELQQPITLILKHNRHIIGVLHIRITKWARRGTSTRLPRLQRPLQDPLQRRRLRVTPTTRLFRADFHSYPPVTSATSGMPAVTLSLVAQFQGQSGREAIGIRAHHGVGKVPVPEASRRHFGTWRLRVSSVGSPCSTVAGHNARL